MGSGAARIVRIATPDTADHAVTFVVLAAATGPCAAGTAPAALMGSVSVGTTC